MKSWTWSSQTQVYNKRYSMSFDSSQEEGANFKWRYVVIDVNLVRTKRSVQLED